MKKLHTLARLTALLFMALMPGISRGQTAADTIFFREAQWNIREAVPGIESGGAELELFGRPQHISFFVIDTSRYNLEVKQSKLLRTRTSRMAKRAKAAAAINGGFFNVKNGRPANLLKEDGKLMGNPSKYKQAAGYIAVTTAGKIEISPNMNGLAEGDSAYEDVLALPHMLINNGKPALFLDPDIHPRSAAGTDGKSLIFMVADGRHPEKASGLTFDETVWVMRMLGCIQALNLDGGGSSTLWNVTEGVVNYPSDNKKFDHKGERKVGSALLVVPRKKN